MFSSRQHPLYTMKTKINYSVRQTASQIVFRDTLMGQRYLVRSLRRLSSKNDEGLDNLDRFAVLIRECGNTHEYSRGKQIHRKIVEEDLFGRYLGNLLIEMYGKCGHIDEAKSVFDKIMCKNVFTWNLLAGAYVENAKYMETIHLYRCMCAEGARADSITILAVIASCFEEKLAAGFLPSLYGTHILEHTLIRNSIITMYGRLGNITLAKATFDDMPDTRTSCTWNALLTAYARNGLGLECVILYRRMLSEGVKCDTYTCLGVLGGVTKTNDVESIQLLISESECVTLMNALIGAYGRCGESHKARSIFDSLTVKNVVTWTVMISAYAQNGHLVEALELIKRMEEVPDVVTIVTILDVCGALADLEYGRSVHDIAAKKELDVCTAVGNVLVDMYGRCGAVQEAYSAFRKVTLRDVQSWSLLIAAYAQTGRALEVVDLFMEMQNEGFIPSEVTMTGVLDVCSHLGLVCEARMYFVRMQDECGIIPCVEHYGCMVDTLGRLGRLEEANEIVECIRYEADVVMWHILLSACRVHGDVERGIWIAENVLGLDEFESGSYVLVSNSIMFLSEEP